MVRSFVLAGGAVLLAVSAPLLPAAPKKPAAKAAKAADPASQAAAAVARLKKDEATVHSGRLSMLIQIRLGELEKGATPATARAEARKAPLQTQAREYLIFSGDDWRRDTTFMDAQGNVGNHRIVGETKGVVRLFEEEGHAEAAKKKAEVGIGLQQNGADRVLFGRGSDLLEGVKWSGAKPETGRLVLSGSRGSEKIELALRTAPRYYIERFTSSESVVTPQGAATRGQEIAPVYEPAKPGVALKSMEFSLWVTGSVNRAAVTTYKVEGAMINEPVRPDELAVAIPQGTPVSDSRFDPPVAYTQGEKDLTLAELKALAGAKAEAGPLKVGAPAPQWELKTLDGKPVKLADYRGRVVLLTWFASWCPPCNAEAPVMEKEIWQKYQGRGLTVLGVNASERQDPEKMAKQFVAKHGVTYPIVMDTEGVASQLYGIEVLPTIAIIDRKGVLRYHQRGFQEGAVIKQIEALVAEGS